MEEALSAIFPILALLEIHHLFGYVHLRIPTTARVSSLASLDIREVEPELVMIPLPLEENRLPRVSLASFNSHRDGRKCSHPWKMPSLRSARRLVQRLCKPLVDLRRFSALLEVDRDLLAQAVTRGL